TTDDPKERKALKEKLPIFTPSGTFSERSAAGLIHHSWLLSFDLDAKANPFLEASTVNAVKAQIAKLPEVAFCQISAGGEGLWGVVLLAFPDRHREQFEALETAFAGMGYTIDPACKDVCRARFWSYDPEPHINQIPEPFTGLPKPKPMLPVFTATHSARPDDLAGQAAEYLIKERVPLECTYANFMQIAFACKNEWGDTGKEIALDILHTCTTFGASNTARNFDTLWKGIRRDGGNVITAGSLVKMAKDAGFKYRSQDTPPTSPQLPRETRPATATIAHGYHSERYTDRNTGQDFEVLLNAEGYPAAWDLPNDQRESLARIIREKPATTELIAHFDLKLEGVQPLTDESEKDWQRAKERAEQVVSRANGKRQMEEEKQRIKSRRSHCKQQSKTTNYAV
ncbi:MAG: BT4734/BF3469 family protein, partial [Saprospiraceae bacterium]